MNEWREHDLALRIDVERSRMASHFEGVQWRQASMSISAGLVWSGMPRIYLFFIQGRVDVARGLSPSARERFGLV